MAVQRTNLLFPVDGSSAVDFICRTGELGFAK